MLEKTKHKNRMKWGREFVGFRKYLFKIILSNVFLVLLPICILCALWSHMILTQAEREFHRQKSIEMNELVSGITQRIKTINLEVALEMRDRKYSTYTTSEDYTTDLWMISKRLATMVEKYYWLHSVYFYDNTTGRIYNSNAGCYDFNSFYDTEWLKEMTDSYSVQQLPLRYSMNDEALYSRSDSFYKQYNDLVLTLVIKGKPDFYLAANISINKLFKDISDTFEMNEGSQEFFFAANGKVIEGTSEYGDPGLLYDTGFVPNAQEVSFIRDNDRIFYAKAIGYGDIICFTSYSARDIYQESQHLEKYIVIVCIGLLIFLLVVSIYMAKRLYQPINMLYSDFSNGTKLLQKEDIHDEIELLKHIFSEMNTFNSNAKLKLKQFDEITRAFRFRNFLERNQSLKDFMKDHPYLFDGNGNGLCEMLVLKLDMTAREMPTEEEMLFRLNLQEVLRTYLQSSLKGILTKNSHDHLVLLYRIHEGQDAEQIRRVLTDTTIKLTNEGAYFALSKPIRKAEEILSQYQILLQLIETAYFLGWNYEIITEERIEKSENSDEKYDTILNIKASFISAVVSQDRTEADKLFEKLENELRPLSEASRIKDICGRIMVDLDHEFHFSKSLGDNLLKALNENETLPHMLVFMKNILEQVCSQYGRNDAKENHYCELAKKYLDENYMRDMNITDVADHLDISYSYLSKIFRTKTGTTLTDYLNNARIEKSKEYLANTFLNIAQISEKVGYNNAQSYQRFFKKYMNITPGDYRKLHTNRTNIN